jgi:hypothetical protein
MSTQRAILRLSFASSDEHRVVTVLALGGLAAAVTMAIFGLPPVDMHGFLHRLGIMDPLCGGTRAVRYAARGQWGLSVKYNPLGLVAVLGACGALVRAAMGILTGRWLTVALTWTPRRARVVVLVALLALAALEVRQQMRSDLLLAVTV